MKSKLTILLLLALSFHSFAAVRLPAVIGDGMVLQRNEPIYFWGWADSNENFELSWMGMNYSITADNEGKWSLTLPAEEGGGPYSMHIAGIEITDIMIGDVYLCTGQSNMELPVSRVTDMFAEEISGYENTDIRHIIIPKEYDLNEERDYTSDASWKPCTQENVMEFSALAYFFAKEIYAKNGIPVGLVNASWGGTPIQAWMSETALNDYNHYLNDKELYADEGYRDRIKQLEGEAFHRWNTTLHENDPGFNSICNWYEIDYNDRNWSVIDMFSPEWGNDGLNPIGGSHWFRKSFKINKRMAGKPATLRLGCIVDADSVYVNGHFVGRTTYQYPPRIYHIPEGVLQRGENNITVRIVSNGGQPSFVKEKPYKIICEKKEIDLDGKWKYSPGAAMPKAPDMMFFHYKPVGLYNAMISPIRNMKFSGVIWYQGESNVERRNEYADLLVRMIDNWRLTFMDDDLPFYIIELADFLHKSDTGGRKAWAEMRDQQAAGVSRSKNAYLIENSDLGEWNDIHPLDKKTLGKRVAKEVIKNVKKQ